MLPSFGVQVSILPPPISSAQSRTAPKAQMQAVAAGTVLDGGVRHCSLLSFSGMDGDPHWCV